MIRKITQYKVKDDQLFEVEQAIQRFVNAIAQAEPETNYAAYRTEDPTVFIHTMAFTDEAAEQAHQQAAYTLKFVDVLYPKCEEQPKFQDLNLVSLAGGEIASG